ncbi:MAG TPA: serine/threonine-protein kinase [Byssovorax sp.]
MAFVDGALDAAAATAFEAHLDACPDCSRLIATYARAYLTGAGGDEAEASAARADGDATSGADRDREAVRRIQRGRALPPGAVVGRYVVLDCLGEGASSIVYGAYDPELDRKVALKVLREGFAATDAEPASQLREARAMAKLGHANIVAVHDVGVAGDRVFIAMELVDGATLRAWLAAVERPTPEILGALCDAGRGLAAMHAAGLVHRDFKPENVLVGKDGRARVTDLGLARVLHGPRGEGPDSDRRAAAPDSGKAGAWTNALAGTPAYMAPEQAAGKAADARSDQYAFAVTLYEALFGERPSRDEAANSTRLRSVPPRASGRPPASAGRRVSKRVRVALERALANEPAGRFASMKELLRALEREAPRGRLLWAGAVAAIVASVFAWAATRALGERSRVCKSAPTELAGVWDAGKKQAISAAFRATGAPFADAALRSVERAGDAYASAWIAARTDACEATRVRGEQSDAVLTLRMECLDRRRRELDAAAKLFARADADVVEHAVSALGAVAPVAACNDTTALLASVRPPESPALRKQVEALRDEIDRVRALDAAGKALAALPDARALVTQAKALHYRPVEAEALFVRGLVERSRADFAAAVPTLYEAVSAAEAGHDDELAAETWATLVDVLVVLDKFDEANVCADRARAAIERAGGAGRAPLILPDALGSMLRELGKYPEAIAQHEAAIALEEKALGPDALEVARSLRNLANARRDNGEPEAALAAYTRALAIQERALGPEHPDVGSTLQSLAILDSRLGRYDEAKPRFARALAIRERRLGPDHPEVGETLSSLVVAMRWTGDAEAALPLAERALRIELAAHGPDHDRTAGAENNVGFIELALHHTDRAKAAFARALAVRKELFGPTGPKVAMEIENLGQAALAERDFAGARDLYARGLAIDEAGLKPDHPDLAYALVGLGLADLGLGKAGDAAPILERALRLREGHAPPRLLAEARFALARALVDAGGDRARSIALAKDAADGYASAGRAFGQERADVAAWLAAHAP